MNEAIDTDSEDEFSSRKSVELNLSDSDSSGSLRHTKILVHSSTKKQNLTSPKTLQQTTIVIDSAPVSNHTSPNGSNNNNEDEKSHHLESQPDEIKNLSPKRPTSRDSEIQSRLSFIVKEKLHEYAKDLRRHEVIREPTPEGEAVSTTDGSSARREEAREQASLMSLIGLHQKLPLGQNYMIWLGFVVFVFLYNAFGIPLRSTYPYQTDENIGYWMVFDYIGDLIYVIDITIVKPRLTFMHILQHYLNSKIFKFDLISLLPLDIFYFVTGPVAAWRCVRILKLFSFWEFFDLLDSSFSNPYIVSYMIYIIHCNSCVYYMLSAWQAFGQIPYRYQNEWYLNKWVYNNQGNAYIRCFYFTAAVATSTGNNPAPTNVVEYIYMTFSWMMGVFVFALLLGQVNNYSPNSYYRFAILFQTPIKIMKNFEPPWIKHWGNVND